MNVFIQKQYFKLKQNIQLQQQLVKNNEEITPFMSIEYEHMNEQVDSLVIIMCLSSQLFHNEYH